MFLHNTRSIVVGKHSTPHSVAHTIAKCTIMETKEYENNI